MAKFKIGDRVKCVGDFDLKTLKEEGKIDTRRIGHGWRKDLVFTITDVERLGEGAIYWVGYNNCGVYEERLVGMDKQLTIE